MIRKRRRMYIVAAALGPYLAWKRADLAGVFGRLKFAAAALALVAAFYLKSGGPVLAPIALGFAAWLFVGAVVEWGDRIKFLRIPLAESLRRARGMPRSAHGMTLAHVGLAIAMAGIIGSSFWKEEAVRALGPGESIEPGGYRYRLEAVSQVVGPNYVADRGRFAVTRDGREVAVLEPEKRLYSVQNMPTTEAAIHTTGTTYLYVVLGDRNEQGGWTVRIYHEPLVPWIWLGTMVMVLGGLVSLSDQRPRIGTPAPRPSPHQPETAGGSPVWA